MGGLILLTFLILSFYRGNSTHIEASTNNEAVIAGSNIAISMIEEITLKKYDHNVQSGEVTPVSGLSTTLGPDGTETGNVLLFDDVDDFNNYSRQDTLPNLGIFNTSVTVGYVHATNPEVIITTKSYTKRIDVTIANEYLGSPIKLYHVVSY